MKRTKPKSADLTDREILETIARDVKRLTTDSEPEDSEQVIDRVDAWVVPRGMLVVVDGYSDRVFTWDELFDNYVDDSDECDDDGDEKLVARLNARADGLEALAKRYREQASKAAEDAASGTDD